jgi:hypothetical protein
MRLIGGTTSRRRRWAARLGAVGLVAALVVVAVVAGWVLYQRWRPELDAAERLWSHSGVNSYEIVVERCSMWSLQTSTVVVRDGAIVEKTVGCRPGLISSMPCHVMESKTEEYTVPGLFAIARDLLDRQSGARVGISFDEALGYPTIMFYDMPNVIDEETLWSVVSFKQL